MEVLVLLAQQVQLVHQDQEEKEEGMVLLENLVQLVNPVELVFLEFLVQKEILGELVLKGVQVFKVQEEKLENLVYLESQEKWVHQERTGAMEKKEDLEFP